MAIQGPTKNATSIRALARGGANARLLKECILKTMSSIKTGTFVAILLKMRDDLRF